MTEAIVTYILNKSIEFLENDMLQFQDGREDIISVNSELERIRAFLKVADSLEEVDEEVRVWIKQFREAAYDIEDVLDELKFLEFDACSVHHNLFQKLYCCMRKYKARCRFMSELRAISSRIKGICDGHWTLRRKYIKDGQDSSSSPSGSRWQDQRRDDALLIDKTDLVGIEEPKRKIVGWVVQGQLNREVISISGMAGSGKTTLVKQVYDDPGVKKHFAIRVWVTLSPYTKRKDVLKDMLQKIAAKIRKVVPKGANTLNIDWLKMMIKQFLQCRKYLIVLDDVWRMERWDAVKYALPNNECGSRILLTTRYADIAFAASGSEFPGKIHEMQPLLPECSWKLFCKKTFQDESCPSHLAETCNSILRKCEGLPLPIIAISGVLASKNKQRVVEWDLVRRSLRSEIDSNDRLKNLKKVLSLSFSDLPYYLKFCFLYLSVFPEGYLIPRKMLIRLWIAEGFVETKEGKTLEEVADYYLDELSNRNLIQVAETCSCGKVKTYRIHELLRDIIITRSRDQNFAATAEKGDAVWPDKVRRLSMQGTFESIKLKNPLSHLRSFFMFYPDKESMTRMLHSGLKLLNVLDLQYAPLKRFPLQLVDNYCLRYLSFRGTEISTIPSSIGNLENLETLDLKHTNVTELPVEIVKLKKLRHLLVYHCESISYDRKTCGFKTLAELGVLQSLQKLCYIEADHRNSDMLTEIGKLHQLKRLCILKLKKEDGSKICSSIEKLTNLRALSISSLDDDEGIDLQHLSSPPQFLQRIYLKGRMEKLPQWISNLHNLTRVHLKNCHLKDDPITLFHGLPNLIHLELHQVYNWRTLCLKKKGFIKLKILGLSNFDELNCIEVEEGALACLEKLMIQRCKLLKDLPSGIEHLTKLKVLEFFDLSDELIQKIKEESQKVAHIPELRYGYWTDVGWEVKSVERSGKEESSSDPGPSIRSSELPPCWK